MNQIWYVLGNELGLFTVLVTIFDKLQRNLVVWYRYKYKLQRHVLCKLVKKKKSPKRGNRASVYRVTLFRIKGTVTHFVYRSGKGGRWHWSGSVLNTEEWLCLYSRGNKVFQLDLRWARKVTFLVKAEVTQYSSSIQQNCHLIQDKLDIPFMMWNIPFTKWWKLLFKNMWRNNINVEHIYN